MQIRIIEQNMQRIDMVEWFSFRVRFQGTYQANSVSFPPSIIPYSLRPRSIWFEYHPQYRIVWNDRNRTLIFLDRATNTELANGTNVDIEVTGRMICSDHE